MSLLPPVESSPSNSDLWLVTLDVLVDEKERATKEAYRYKGERVCKFMRFTA